MKRWLPNAAVWTGFGLIYMVLFGLVLHRSLRAESLPAGGSSAAMWESSIEARGDRVDAKAGKTYRAYYNAGRARLEAGDIGPAIKHFKVCHAHAPHDSLAWQLATIMLGVACEQLDEPEKAAHFYAEYMRHANPIVMQARTDLTGAWRRYRLRESRTGE